MGDDPIPGENEPRGRGEPDGRDVADAPPDEFPPDALDEARRLNELPDQDPEESTGIDV